MTKVIIIFIASVSIVAMGYQLFRLQKQNRGLAAELQQIEAELLPLRTENKKIAEEIDYYKNPDNLEKKLRSRFNYARPGEKLYLVIP